MKNSNKQASSASSGKKVRVGFNFIDVLLIAFILAFVLLVINIVSPMSLISTMFKEESQTIYYTVEFVGVDEEYVEMILENDTVIDSVSKNTLGTVSAVDNTQYTTLEYNEAEDIFVHYSAINQDGYKTLSEGQEVTFNLVSTSKGYQAQNVKVVKELSEVK